VNESIWIPYMCRKLISTYVCGYEFVTHVYMYTHMFVSLYMYIDNHTPTYLHMNIYIYITIFAYIYMCTYVYMSAIGTAPCAVSNRESRYPPLGWDEELCRVYQEEIFAWYAQRVGRTDNTQIQAWNPGLPSLRECISRSYGQAR